MILKVAFQENDSILKVAFAENSSLIQIDFGEIYELGNEEAAEFTGPYDVTPDVAEQILATEQRIMRRNLVIREIPYHRVSNIKGGDTVTIG